MGGIYFEISYLIPLCSENLVVVAKTQIGELLLEKQVRGEEKTGTVVVDYPGIKAADVKCCYLFVLSADGSKASMSTYVSVSNL